jgi:hypothetical protein
MSNDSMEKQIVLVRKRVLTGDFFSTITNEKLACVYAGDGNNEVEYSVLLKIDVDWSLDIRKHFSSQDSLYAFLYHNL